MSNVAKEAAKAAGSQTALAKALGCSPQNVQWMCTTGQIPAKHVLKVEAVTGIPRSRLRPDMYPSADEAVMAMPSEDLSNGHDLPAPLSCEIINDETMSLLSNDQLAWRIWSSLNEIEVFTEAEGIAEWPYNQNDVYCGVAVALICARVLARRMIGMEPSAIAEEHHRLFMKAAGLPVDGGES